MPGIETNDRAALTSSVTSRQWEVAELVALGYSNAEIARELSISLAGAKYHVGELLHRLGYSSREAIAAWYRHERLTRAELPGLLEDGERHGWPRQLMRRALDLGVPRHRVAAWRRERLSADEVEAEIRRHERVMLGDLRARIADADDADRLADLYRNAPQDVDEWELVVERGPYTFAQLRLQEHAWVQLVEEAGLAHAAVANSVRETVVAGRRVTVLFRYAAKVRRRSRGKGFGGLSLWAPPASAPSWHGIYYLVRERNLHLLRWLRSMAPNAAELVEPPSDEVPGIPVVVDSFPASGNTAPSSGIRRARRSDLRRCVSLINRTHRGLDLFRPYTVEYLERRLNDAHWGPKPSWWIPVYGWPDYYVVEDGGVVVACGGLWDRGRDVREIWRHRETAQEYRVSTGALMDFGFADGRPDAAARLCEFFIELTGERGRTHFLAPLQWLPAVRERLACHGAVAERRRLIWRLTEGDRSIVDRSVHRPHIDLAYWA